jgi:hypothetical protein
MLVRLYFLIAISLSTTVFGQKNLAVDRIFTTSFSFDVNTVTLNVPQNRIWKVERLGTTCLNSGKGRIELNNNRTDLWKGVTTPLWLGSNDSLKFYDTRGAEHVGFI